MDPASVTSPSDPRRDQNEKNPLGKCECTAHVVFFLFLNTVEKTELLKPLTKQTKMWLRK